MDLEIPSVSHINIANRARHEIPHAYPINTSGVWAVKILFDKLNSYRNENSLLIKMVGPKNRVAM